MKSNFAPDDVKLMGGACDEAWNILRTALLSPSDDYEKHVRRQMAARVMAALENGERDPGMSEVHRSEIAAWTPTSRFSNAHSNWLLRVATAMFPKSRGSSSQRGLSDPPSRGASPVQAAHGGNHLSTQAHRKNAPRLSNFPGVVRLTAPTRGPAQETCRVVLGEARVTQQAPRRGHQCQQRYRRG